MTRRRRPTPARALAVLLPALAAGCSAPTPARIEAAASGDEVQVTVAGAPFCTWRSGARRPVVWPLRNADGVPVTRAWPLDEVAGEPRDHPHHESLWFAHGAVDGVDFWAGDGRIVEQSRDVSAGGEVGGVSRWQRADGTEVCRDFHRFGFRGGPGWRAVDVDLSLVASNGDLRLGDTKEGTFALRLRPELTLRGGGHIRNSEGHVDGAAWGKRARWVAYTGEVDGRFVLVAVFDHPDNHEHPTWWHARDYGLCAANPFGVHDFTGAPPGTGDLVLLSGAQLRFRYRVFLGGRDDADRLDDLWREWADGGH